MRPYKILLAICFIAFVISCKKNKNDDTFPTSPVINYKAKTMDYMVNADAGYHYRIFYNVKNDVDYIIVTGIGTYSTKATNFLKFLYSDSSCMITSTFSNSSAIESN